MHDVAQDWLRKEVKLQPEGSGQIRIFEIGNGAAQKIFTGTEPVRDISESVELFAEEIPMDEIESEDAKRIVPVFHYSKEPNRTHGIPFRFVLLPVSFCLITESSSSLLTDGINTTRSRDRARSLVTRRSAYKPGLGQVTKIWPR